MHMSKGLVSYIVLCVLATVSVMASARAAGAEGSLARYNLRIDMKEAYIGGICMIRDDESLITASVLNEFGVSMMTLSHDKAKDKTKIVNCIKQLRNPMIRKVLKQDFQIIFSEYQKQDPSSRNRIEHINQKHRITYNLIPF